jgi:protein-S-isoprenylcysteine O-methyltransferase Ste14
MPKLIIQGFLIVFIPFVYFLNLLIISAFRQTTSVILATGGLLITLAGLFLWIAGFWELRTSFATLPQAQKLITSGVYKYFSHPIYLGITLTFLGLSLAYNSKAGLGYTLLIVLPLNLFRAKLEEKVLLKKFKSQYQNYKNSVIF